jgi:nephrocystin-3
MAAHPKARRWLEYPASAYRGLKQYQEALINHERAIAIQEDTQLGNHPDLANSYNNIAETFQATGNYNKAKEYESKADAIRGKRSE